MGQQPTHEDNNPGFCSNMLIVGWKPGTNDMNQWLHHNLCEQYKLVEMVSTGQSTLGQEHGRDLRNMCHQNLEKLSPAFKSSTIEDKEDIMHGFMGIGELL